MIYLASPYSHPNGVVRKTRFKHVVKIASTLIQRGIHVFSPIIHAHEITQHGLPMDWDYWSAYCEWFLERCEEMVIATIGGWGTSEGIAKERIIMQAMDKPVYYVNFDGEFYDLQKEGHFIKRPV